MFASFRNVESNMCFLLLGCNSSGEFCRAISFTYDIQIAVTSMQDARDVVELTILRDSRETPPLYVATSDFTVWSFNF